MILKDISAKEAYELVKNDNTCVIDVRRPNEFNEAHINGAININVESESFIQDVNKLNKDKIYIVHCRSGVRSGKAIEMMKEFSNIQHMNGGMLEWLEKSLPFQSS